jgi:uracil-DNA glycosylase family 4
VGKSGQLLDIALNRAGIDRSQAYVTNALRCLPPKNKQGSNAPSKEAINACRERLAEEVVAHPRKLILTLGNSAARSLTGDHNFKITSKRGLPIDLEEMGVWMPTMHPAAILRNQGETPRWLGDLEYAGRIANGGRSAIKRPPRPTAHIQLLEPGEKTFYTWLRELTEGGRVTTTDYDVEREWDPDTYGSDGTHLPDWPITKVSTGIPGAVRALEGLLGWPLLAADIETGRSYSPRLGEVLALSVAFSETDAVVFSEGLLKSKAFRPYLRKLLTHPGLVWVGHNFKYDSGYLRHQLMGGEWPDTGALIPYDPDKAERGGYHDTMLQHYTLDEAKGTHDLEKVSRDLLGAVDYKNIVRKYAVKSNKAKDITADQGYENVPREVLYPYAALDTCHTFAIHKILYPKIQKSKSLSRLYHKLLLPASGFLQKVQDYGLYVNQPYIDIIEVQLREKLEKAVKAIGYEVNEVETNLYPIDRIVMGKDGEADMKTTEAINKKEGPTDYGPLWDTDLYMKSVWATKKRPDGFNPRNYRHTTFALYRLLGWVPMNTNERTLRDLDQTGRDQSATFGYKAKNYARGHPNRKQKLNFPFIQALIDARLSGHAYNMLVTGTRKATEPDGRMHTTFNLQATETGRLSSTGPNLQNLPVPEKDDPLPARDIVGAGPGRVIMEADYSQVELRLLAHFSNDPGLIDVYKTGRDLHTELSIAIWGDRTYDSDGKQISGYTNYQRVRAKAVNFGIAYGRGAGSIAAEHDIPIEEAQEMRQAWFKRFANAAKWLDELHRSPLTGRTVVTPFGRRRRFGVVSRDNYVELKNQSANFPMQSTASDLNMYSGMRIQEKWDRLGIDAHVVCLVHDAIVVECPEETANERAAELRAMMEDTPRRVLATEIEFPVDVHIGRAWGSLKLEEMTTAKPAEGAHHTDTFGKAGVASGKL